MQETKFYLLFGLAIWRPRLGLAAALACAALNWMPLPPGLEPLRAWGATWDDALFPLGIAAAWAARHAPCRRPGALALGGAPLFLLAGLAENAGLLPLDGWPGRFAYGLPAAAVLVGLIQSEHAGQLRVPPALALLGAASYSVYLVHSPMLGYAARAMAASGRCRSFRTRWRWRWPPRLPSSPASPSIAGSSARSPQPRPASWPVASRAQHPSPTRRPTPSDT